MSGVRISHGSTLLADKVRRFRCAVTCANERTYRWRYKKRHLRRFGSGGVRVLCVSERFSAVAVLSAPRKRLNLRHSLYLYVG